MFTLIPQKALNPRFVQVKREVFDLSESELVMPRLKRTNWRYYLHWRVEYAAKAAAKRAFNRKSRRERAWSIEADQGFGSSDDEVAPPL
ncbi:hypothetical protein JTE90_003460, partial [Oedothorax gibbosus]